MSYIFASLLVLCLLSFALSNTVEIGTFGNAFVDPNDNVGNVNVEVDLAARELRARFGRGFGGGGFGRGRGRYGNRHGPVAEEIIEEGCYGEACYPPVVAPVGLDNTQNNIADSNVGVIGDVNNFDYSRNRNVQDNIAHSNVGVVGNVRGDIGIGNVGGVGGIGQQVGPSQQNFRQSFRGNGSCFPFC
eukprot:Platyproteum_vivax@DN4666_c0_g1_i2.p1